MMRMRLELGQSAPWFAALTLSTMTALGTGCSGNNASTGNNPDSLGDSDGSATAGGEANTNDGDIVSCDDDPRVDRAVGGTLRKTGALGQISAELATMDPAPPAVTNNTWTVLLRDASGALFPDATLIAAAKMPDHSHPPAVPPVVTPAGAGSYSITPLYFFMPGVWQVRLDVYGPNGLDAGPALDAIVFTACVE